MLSKRPVLRITELKKIKPSLYSRYYAEACNEWRDPSPQLSAWATQLRRSVAAVASRCVDLTGPGIEPQTSRTDSVRLATELTGRLKYGTKSMNNDRLKFKNQTSENYNRLVVIVCGICSSVNSLFYHLYNQLLTATNFMILQG